MFNQKPRSIPSDNDYFLVIAGFIVCWIFLLTSIGGNQAAAQTGKRPVIIIPAVTGSTLVDSNTGEKAWLKVLGLKPESLRLPISPNLRANKDALAAKDILRRVELPGILPDITVYQDILDALAVAGYAEADWNNPAASDVVYVFAYDWRRDNVESAQQLIAKIEAVKLKLNRPALKFDVIAHSMGGLIARYAAMYGGRDLPPDEQIPAVNWTGAAHFNSIHLFGTPNHGTVTAFSVLIGGYQLGAGKIVPPLVNIPKEVVFTIPSLYQMLPFKARGHFLDENLQPLQVDLYNAETWLRYDWGAIAEPRSTAHLNAAATSPTADFIKARGQRLSNKADSSKAKFDQAREFLQTVLTRAAKFQRALGQTGAVSPIKFYTYGSGCKPTLDAVVLIRGKKNEWKTVTKAKTITTAGSAKYSREKLQEAMYRDGDGRVTQNSLLNHPSDSRLTAMNLMMNNFKVCEQHDRLLNKNELQAKLLGQLIFKNN